MSERYCALGRHHPTVHIDRLVGVALWLRWRAPQDLRYQLSSHNRVEKVVDDHPLGCQPVSRRIGQGPRQPVVLASVKNRWCVRKDQLLVVARVADQGRAVIPALSAARLRAQFSVLGALGHKVLPLLARGGLPEGFAQE